MAKPKIDQDPTWLETQSGRTPVENWKVTLALREIHESIRLKNRLARECVDQIIEIADTITDALRIGGKVALFGNGGSAADAQHIAAELVGKFVKDRPPLRALAFTTNSSIVTAIGNDFAFDQVFARQVIAQIDKGDVVIGISTSGRSKNVINGIREARRLVATTIALTGASGGPLAKLCDHAIIVPSSNTQRIQESHIMIGHIICGLIETSLWKYPSTAQTVSSPDPARDSLSTRVVRRKSSRLPTIKA